MFVLLAELLEQGGKADSVPSQLRHCMVAVAKKQGGGERGARAAWNICRWHLTRSGYMKKPYRRDAKATPSRLKMTQKGVRASMKHSKEPDVDKKNKEFHRLFRSIEKYV